MAFKGREKENEEGKNIKERETMGGSWTEESKSLYALLLMIQSYTEPGF